MHIPQIIVTNAYTVVELQWNPSNEPDFLEYEVHMSEELSGNYSSVGRATETYFHYGPVISGRTYYFIVYAWDSNGNRSVASDEIIINVP